ncbi:MAG: hypothetical protein K1X83_06905 [Oligoflexia bacterium]|nr:hypothetical protein [Oligoflexia bacterium]
MKRVKSAAVVLHSRKRSKQRGEIVKRKELRAEIQQPGQLENVVVYPSFLAQLHLVALLLISCVFTVYASLHFSWATQTLTLPHLFGYEISLYVPLFGLIPLVVLGALAHRLLDRCYILSDDYILEIEGRLSWTLRTVRLRYLHIRGLELDRTIWQHLLDIGDLRVGGEISPEDTDVVMYGIYKPQRYKDLIKERIDLKLKTLTNPTSYRLVGG